MPAGRMPLRLQLKHAGMQVPAPLKAHVPHAPCIFRSQKPVGSPRPESVIVDEVCRYGHSFLSHWADMSLLPGLSVCSTRVLGSLPLPPIPGVTQTLVEYLQASTADRHVWLQGQEEPARHLQ